MKSFIRFTGFDVASRLACRFFIRKSHWDAMRKLSVIAIVVSAPVCYNKADFRVRREWFDFIRKIVCQFPPRWPKRRI